MTTSVMVAPELEGDGKTVKNDYGALTGIVNATIKTGAITVYGPQGFGMGSANIFSSTPGSQAYPVRDHDPKAFSNALNNHGNWTKAYEFGASQINQTIKNVYFDAFGRIHYSQ